MTRAEPDLPAVEVLIEDPGWEGFGLETLAPRALGAALAALGLPGAGHEAALLACDDARIAALNAQWRGKAGPTNVLSWPAFPLAPPGPGAPPPPPPRPAPGRPVFLGDIALARGTVLAEAEAAGLAPRDHAFHLLLHAALHLLGHDHVRPADAARMEGIERRVLASMGLHDPYSSPGAR